MPAAAQTVLVVEEDPGLRRLLQTVLPEAGYDVAQAWDGAAACLVLDRLRAPNRDLGLVLLNLGLPVVDGMGVLGHLAAARYDVPVIAMSGDPFRLDAAREAGAIAVLPKPFAVSELLKLMAQHLSPSD